jgi:hypothetical protein
MVVPVELGPRELELLERVRAVSKASLDAGDAHRIGQEISAWFSRSAKL